MFNLDVERLWHDAGAVAVLFCARVCREARGLYTLGDVGYHTPRTDFESLIPPRRRRVPVPFEYVSFCIGARFLIDQHRPVKIGLGGHAILRHMSPPGVSTAA